MKLRFPGFPPEAMPFFRGLAQNNRREWFQPRKPVYEEQVKAPMLHLVEAVNTAMNVRSGLRERSSQGRLPVLSRHSFQQGQDAVQDHIAAELPSSRPGREGGGAGFYFAVSHKEVGVGRRHLHAVPRDAAGPSARTSRIFIANSRAPEGPGPKTAAGRDARRATVAVPRVLPPSIPRRICCATSSSCCTPSSSRLIATTPELYEAIVSRFKAMTPFMEFLNAPLAAKTRKMDPHDLFR